MIVDQREVTAVALDTGEGNTYACGPGTATGLDVGSATAPVQVAPADQGYVITAHSKSGNHFLITKDPTTGVSTRSCTSTGASSGGCNGPGSQTLLTTTKSHYERRAPGPASRRSRPSPLDRAPAVRWGAALAPAAGAQIRR